ncbi:type II toxin-antitoxin system HicA family toxin [Pedobacter aquatilis]|uniref:type II toxin-antitoxin system HicA family toxin n=1 Tax=Pedobacter aquatilis TaxID=351343 RepID=UPI0025B2C2A7|nr:type II toxin-antitoxin system HicA family toxin [Pedobacter aquatilis]MDN3588268.1 type II toxin-antitoxin system HicA family toxin [Pedobacter aquatilis]
MKTPRDLSATDLIKILNKFGYEITTQRGSHIRITVISGAVAHHITIPNHNPLKLGTLLSIINDVSEFLKIPKSEILK